MGFLDKAKQQAQDLKGKVEGKVEDVQVKRKADAQLEVLGRLVYAQRTDRPAADTDGEIGRIVEALRALEAEGASVLPEAAPMGPPAGS
jgi:hypothetical protein